MSSLFNLFRAATGVVVLLGISSPRLTTMDIDAKSELCASRRASLRTGSVIAPSETVCPFGNVPFAYRVTVDGKIEVVCPNGDDEDILPRDRWVTIQ